MNLPKTNPEWWAPELGSFLQRTFQAGEELKVVSAEYGRVHFKADDERLMWNVDETVFVEAVTSTN